MIFFQLSRIFVAYRFQGVKNRRLNLIARKTLLHLIADVSRFEPCKIQSVKAAKARWHRLHFVKPTICFAV